MKHYLLKPMLCNCDLLPFFSHKHINPEHSLCNKTHREHASTNRLKSIVELLGFAIMNTVIICCYPSKNICTTASPSIWIYNDAVVYVSLLTMTDIL